jgi:hypothetical protein
MIASDDLIAGLLNRNELKTGHGNPPSVSFCSASPLLPSPRIWEAKHA